jgi:cell division septal protein FtsQ
MARRSGASRFRVRVLPSVLLTAAILLLPALLYAWGRQADAFSVERITVSGGRRVSETKALRALRKDFLGRNLFTVTTEDVHGALDSLCYLASVQVDRDFPTTLRVRLVEHRPAAYVLAEGRWFVVSDTGHVICEVAKATTQKPAAGGTPAATPSTSSSASPTPSSSASPSADAGEAGAAAAPSSASDDAAVAAALAEGPPAMRPALPRMATSTLPVAGRLIADQNLRAGLRVLAGLPASLRAKVQVVRVGAAGQMSLTLAGGPNVELGGEERLVAKVLSLRAVLAAYQRADTEPTFIDVSSPDRPLGRPRLSS